MKAYLALVSREIHERRALLAAAAVAALLPLIAPLLPSTGTNPPEDIREAVMWVMVFGLVPLFALLLGAGFIGRDLTEGRLGFYFAQPISGPTIWFGKLTAVVLLIWSAQVIVMLPTVLLAPDRLTLIAPKGPLGPYDPLWFTVLPLWLGPIGVLLLAHAMGTIWRARSAWVVVDLLGFLVVIGVVWILFRPFFFLFASGVVKVGLLWLVSVFLGGLLFAGAVQLSSGRVDPRRGHRALSLALWSILIIGVAALGGWTWWIRMGSPRDLSAVNEIAVGASDWIAVKGPSPGRADFQPRFIMNATDGRWFRANSNQMWEMRDVVFAKDDSRVVWLSPITFGASKLMVADLDVNEPKGRESDLDFDVFVRDMALSDDGDRLAVIEDTTVMVFDLDSRTQLAAAQIDDDFKPHQVTFEDRDRVRIETVDSTKNVTKRWRYQTRFFDIAGKSLSGGDEPRTAFYRMTIPRDDGLSLVSFYDVSDEEQQMILVDEVTGELVAELGKMPNWSNLRVVGNRLVVFRWAKGSEWIEIFDGYGELKHEIELGEVGTIFDGGEITSGRVVVGFWNWNSAEGIPETRGSGILDVATGQMDKVLDGYVPVVGFWGTGISPGAWDAGSTAGRIMLGENGSLHLWDPETNELERLIPVPD